ncbi:hypothetical protein FOTG_18814 [Fusarium oxysporum f. sp. vasinfectum 25433]|uniref:Uncharacterized protein n=1 Tax=Fusarium oxysporum f. sp. vasinfectum 25433 TaxID=1089449 RepID=X0KVJ1_FUSOX|nr:hypothetical protein FOTG_18814 [Fusarium oxysporum f. sp. vasinfectum 25433]
MHVLAGWSQEAEDASASQIRAQPSSSSHFDDVQDQGQDQGQDTIVVRGTTPQSLQTTEESDLPTRSQPALSPSPPLRQPVPELPYYATEAIYRRYVAARAAWYESQPAGSLKTNQEYRRAIGLLK